MPKFQNYNQTFTLNVLKLGTLLLESDCLLISLRAHTHPSCKDCELMKRESIKQASKTVTILLAVLQAVQKHACPSEMLQHVIN